MEAPSIHRNRRWYAMWLLLTVIIGLGSRKFAAHLPGFVAEYAGDTMWTLHFFLWIGFVLPAIPTGRAALSALLFSYLVEFSQFYHAPWIDAIRSTTPGGLLLGYDFLVSDLVCYTVGAAIGAIAEYVFYSYLRNSFSTPFSKHQHHPVPHRSNNHSKN